VWYESLLERDRLLLADFDPDAAEQYHWRVIGELLGESDDKQNGPPDLLP
jgi:hypothetical protein